MQRIMPPGYSLPQRCRRLESELRQARAAELEKATAAERAKIEKEIRAEANKQLGWHPFKGHSSGSVIW